MRGAGIGAPGACCVGEHVVVRALEGDAPLFVAADFFHHWVVSGVLGDAQTSVIESRTRVQKLR